VRSEIRDLGFGVWGLGFSLGQSLVVALDLKIAALQTQGNPLGSPLRFVPLLVSLSLLLAVYTNTHQRFITQGRWSYAV
jgi:hypothetical protein